VEFYRITHFLTFSLQKLPLQVLKLTQGTAASSTLQIVVIANQSASPTCYQASVKIFGMEYWWRFGDKRPSDQVGRRGHALKYFVHNLGFNVGDTSCGHVVSPCLCLCHGRSNTDTRSDPRMKCSILALQVRGHCKDSWWALPFAQILGQLK
jgi:hypothetical protein